MLCRMQCRARVAPALLLHASLMLALVAGAGLATAARLKWDPTTYIALRELFPAEYHVGAAMLCAASWALLALGHLAALALAVRSPRLRRALLLTYAALMAALVCGEVAWAWWTGARVAAWLGSEAAAQAAEVLEVREHLEPLLQFLSRWHPLPGRVRELMQEAEADAPRNLYAGGAALLLAAALQPAAALLALLCAARPARLSAAAADSTDERDSRDRHVSYSSEASERAPLKAAYRGGRLVLV